MLLVAAGRRLICLVCLPFNPCFSHFSLGQVVCCRVRCEGAFLCIEELTRGAVTCLDASYSWLHTATGFTRPIPPSLAGRASSALSTFEQGDRPVSAGLNF